MKRTIASFRQLQRLQVIHTSTKISNVYFLSHPVSRQYCSNSSEAAKYERKSPTEHVLLRPDTYIGGVGMREHQDTWIFDEKSQRILCKDLTYPPGLLKIFDEILVNAADNKCRDPEMSMLKVTIDKKTSRISVWNNGKGLPIEVHPVEKIYVPTLIFGNLFTSSNYNDNVIKTVGGRNGYGAKLCNIFSKEFVVETVDVMRGKKFRQVWHDNMKQCDDAIVEEIDNLKATYYTKIEFVPDLARFHIDHLTDEIIELIHRRVYEVAATLPRDVTVFLNDEVVKTNGFEEYVRLFLPQSASSELLFFHPTSRWHVGISKRKVENEEGTDETVLPGVISFVNNINTEKGGTHVDYVLERIVGAIKKEVDSKLESTNNTAKPSMIKNNISLFLNCLIENPSFESQTKETLTTKPKFFGSTFEFDSKIVVEWAEETGLLEEIINQILYTKKTKKNKSRKDSSNVEDIVKLEDATWAGTDKSKLCTLIVTEGDSAKALALSGLEILGRENYGVYPLKGKLANVSNLDEKRAHENEEVSSLMRILGLKFGQSSEEINLRYGKLMVLADQDEDGSHIKGLVINFIHRFWPELLRNGFVNSFRTPLLKARKGKEVYSFFDYCDFKKWEKSTEDSAKYTVKYYKGLGTSTSNEARQYFSNLEHHIVEFKYENSEDDSAIRMAFDRDKTDERKEWIRKYEEENGNDKNMNSTEISYKQFVDRDLMRFGVVDLRRSIPCLVDGLKPSQRKILWTLLNMEENKEIKVSQLAGAVAHSQSYHHGEESLVRTTVRMGQTFCGSSNLPLLQPIGQFGTRHEGGHDAASARYIFTALSPITRLIFPDTDNSLLERRVEDGQTVEPKWLCPIIPLVLVNGAEGIGTGWSTKIANRSISDVIDLTRRMIEQESLQDSFGASPSVQFENFSGKIQQLSSNKFATSGNIQLIRPERKNSPTFEIEITELPIGIWTSKYKEKLRGILKELDNVSFSEHHTEKCVNFRITLNRKLNSNFLRRTNLDLLKFFKLNSTITENLVLFNSHGKLDEFDNVFQIANDYFGVRRSLYESRLKSIEMDYENKLRFLDNQIKFINAVTSGTINLMKTNRQEVELQMIEIGIEPDPIKTNKNDFNYLLEMPLFRLTPEEKSRLEERREKRKTDLYIVKNSDWKCTWMDELDKLKRILKK